MKSFNSKLVRLKERIDATICVKVKEFQFQTGSIKSFATRLMLGLKIISFNSKLVRLKVKDDASMEYQYELFQFQTGSIKS